MAEQFNLNDDSAKRAKKNGPSEPPADVLAGSGFEHLPECFAMTIEGAVVQEREPCYQVASECVLGFGREVTLYEEGAIIVTNVTPNDQMVPLNRAAAVNVVRWRERLPVTRVPLDIGDMAEAAQMLGSDPEAMKLNTFDWQNMLVKFATELKLRREGKDAREIPPIGHNFVRGPAAGGSPLLGARIAHGSENLPGATRFATAVPAYGPGSQAAAQVRRAGPAPMSHPGSR